MEAPNVIAELVRRFDDNSQTYRSSQYNEAQLRQEFLNPFFESLGWDIYNKKGYSDAYKEVIHEAAIKVGGQTKAPDYCFRAGGGRPSFFVEAKKPAVDIAEAVSPAYQLRRYAWSAKLPVSILTDFEELAVYDCRVRPVKTDKPATARILYFTYKEYEARWGELCGLFSPEAIRRGGLERFVSSKKAKKGTAEVDAAFLAEIEGWRDLLARNFALRNPGISPRDLNVAVQRTIDRIVFLRICEDRGIEPYGTLQSVSNGAGVYRRLGELFSRADERYNSGVFHFAPEKDRAEPPDEFTLALALDDKPLRQIVESLYYPESPYEFSVLPAEILGQVYEQFLGKVIRLTKGHQAKVEEKPEVRKAGGVYYTPAYIVDYIVRETVGKLLEEGGKGKAEGGKRKPSGGRMTPKEAARLRILDSACGSGSFLIGVYQFLLEWHRDQYVADDPEKHARGRDPKLYRGPAGDWRLTTAERKRILLNSIYGVDIDPQAVEVTKLSLLLKVLEGQSKEAINNQLRLFHERALPDLGQNVKCGNSLIGPDFYADQQQSLFDQDQMHRINAFDWKAEFPQVFRGPSAGFDAVVGNPPYVRVANVPESQRPYLYSRYHLVHRFDLYIPFVLRGLDLLSPSGRLGYIVPNKFITAEYGVALRRVLGASEAVHRIVDFGDSQVFGGPTTYTCLLFLTHRQNDHFLYARARPNEAGDALDVLDEIGVKIGDLSESPWMLVPASAVALVKRMQRFPKLGGLCTVVHGLQTGYDEVFLLESLAAGEMSERSKVLRVRSKVEERPFSIERAAVRPVVKGAVDIRRYYIEASGRWVLFPYSLSPSGPALHNEATYAERFPRAWAYVNRHEREMRRRKGKNWYAYRRRNYDLGEGVPRILVPSIGQHVAFACDLTGNLHYIGSGGGGGGGYGLTLKEGCGVSILYLLGLLNSRLLDWHVRIRSSRFGHGYYAYNRQYIEPLPIPTTDMADSHERASHDRMARLVEGMLSLQQRLVEARTEHDKTVLRRQIEAADRQIDQLVYELYGMSDDEIRLVEEATLA